VFVFFARTFELRRASQAKPTVESQMQTINQGENSMKPELLTKRDTATTTHQEKVRARAYELYEVRGRIDGHAEEDWLQAEGEVAGSNGRKAVRASTSRSL
jgi:hypothetical protein